MDKRAVLSKMDWLIIIVALFVGTIIVVVYLKPLISGWLPIK